MSDKEQLERALASIFAFSAYHLLRVRGPSDSEAQNLTDVIYGQLGKLEEEREQD